MFFSQKQSDGNLALGKWKASEKQTTHHWKQSVEKNQIFVFYFEDDVLTILRLGGGSIILWFYAMDTYNVLNFIHSFSLT